MLILLLGTLDTGEAILINQKTINATQMIGDLLGREDSVSTAELNDAVEAGKLTMMPYSTQSFGVDIAGIQFVGGPNNPQVMWRHTVNMDPNILILENADGLGADGDGVLGVTVSYTYTPYFSFVLTGAIEMSEVSYVRGRRGLYIPKV